MAGAGRRPCIVGVAQSTWRPGERTGGDPAPEPLAMWEEVARAAAADTGGRAGEVLAALERIDVVYCQSWSYDDPPGRLAARLGADPAHRRYSGIGGTTPQLLVSEAAEAVLRGELDLALVVGAEALSTRRRLRKEGRKPEWSHRHPSPPPFPFEAPFHPAEVAHEVFQAWLTFAVFDLARRAHLGVDPDAHRAEIGRLMASLTEVAADNPHAWFPARRTAEELATPTPENRLVGYPYTKLEVSIMDVDMAAAVLVASDEAADRLGVPADRRVHLRGWCDATDPVYVAERDELWRSPAMAAAGAEALSRAGVGIDDVAHLDLYSCFASSLAFATDALGIAADDRRGLTVTGGLPFAGGPGSNYMTHALAAMVDRLRGDPGSLGMVSGVGMHMTKHAFGLYGTEPAGGEVRPPDRARVQSGLDALGTRPIAQPATGPATVSAYSVVHGRDGAPAWGLAVCDLAGSTSGERAYAKVLDPGLLAEMERIEWVGAEVELVAGEGDANLVR